MQQVDDPQVESNRQRTPGTHIEDRLIHRRLHLRGPFLGETLTGGFVNSLLNYFNDALTASDPAEFTMSRPLLPGTFVRHPERPEWGLGQVQSAVGNRVTVNFENAGKRLINSDVVRLERVDERGLGRDPSTSA